MYNKAYILSLKYPVSDYILSFYDNCQVSFFFKKKKDFKASKFYVWKKCPFHMG